MKKTKNYAKSSSSGGSSSGNKKSFGRRLYVCEICMEMWCVRYRIFVPETQTQTLAHTREHFNEKYVQRVVFQSVNHLDGHDTIPLILAWHHSIQYPNRNTKIPNFNLYICANVQFCHNSFSVLPLFIINCRIAYRFSIQYRIQSKLYEYGFELYMVRSVHGYTYTFTRTLYSDKHTHTPIYTSRATCVHFIEYGFQLRCEQINHIIGLSEWRKKNANERFAVFATKYRSTWMEKRNCDAFFFYLSLHRNMKREDNEEV